MNPWLETKNLLAVRLDNGGDVIMLGPALQAIKETSPNVRLTLLATKAGAAAAELLPWLDDVIVWRPIWQDLGRATSDPERDRTLIAMLAERKFDGAVIFTSFSQTPHVAGYVCYLAGIPLRAGESKEFGGATLTDEFRSGPDDLHQVERNLGLVERLGFVARHRDLRITIPDIDREHARAHLDQQGIAQDAPFVLVHPGASAQSRRLPPAPLNAALKRLRSLGVPMLITGAEKEQELVEATGRELGATSLVGTTSLVEFAALIEAAAVVVCGNTLPLHLADAIGTPLVLLYSGTDLVSQWRPRSVPNRLLRRDTPCTPCYLFECPIGQPCLDVRPREIVEAVLDLLQPVQPAEQHNPTARTSAGVVP